MQKYIFINFFRWVFSDNYTESNATSLDTILPESCAVIIGFSCTVWTKMRSLAGSLADCVLADCVLADGSLIHPCPPIMPTNIRKVRGPPKKYGN